MKASTRSSRKHITELHTSAPRRKTKKQEWPERKFTFCIPNWTSNTQSIITKHDFTTCKIDSFGHSLDLPKIQNLYRYLDLRGTR